MDWFEALTRQGRGAFGNELQGIEDAVVRALKLAAGFDLDVQLVSPHGHSPAAELARRYPSRAAGGAA